MPGLAKPDGARQLQLDADDLLDAILAEIGVLRREGRLRIDPRDRRLDRLVRARVDVDAGRLTDLDRADAAFRDETAQVDLGRDRPA